MTRRSLLLSTLSTATLSAIAEAQQHAQAATAAKAAFRYLSADDAPEIEALASQIIPSGETPGAKEAGCIHFIDRALETFDKEKRGLYRTGLARGPLAIHARFVNGGEAAGLVFLVRVVHDLAFAQAGSAVI